VRYRERRTRTFQAKLDGFFAQKRRAAESKIRLILSAPRTACHSERLRWDFAGKRSARLDRRYRIIYTICEECYQQGDQGSNLMDCLSCDNVSIETVTFLDILDYHA
jgi:Txe/YoeB family toxin of Txe-Axe toxin-antitoxin module